MKTYADKEELLKAIKEINQQIDKLMSQACAKALGGWGDIISICENLDMLADAIFEEGKRDFTGIDPALRYDR